MQQYITELFTTYEQIAFLLSILINILISVLGVVPSVFLTAANLTVFGLWEGLLLSFIGEAVGAVVAFYLYRKGFRSMTERKLSHPKVQKLLRAQDREAFSLILALRLLPFVPSGLVTFVAAIGRVSLLVFAVASSLGKVPALLIEGYSVYQVINWTWEGKVIVTALAVVLLFITWRRLRK
ncbi:VTT domain-containing protein [Ectobacillus sp. JY-23]|uniref:TVP38/TMEM64 family protein n=1 Tax=Ectobacillus sp. JY-23 TaxID=2933872 RepID=UPI001FF6703F|nr:VTT domain-containing protein [Ectobacillus sp. JY-23]UOY92443.1 VTT domain-containing protein [Ectobacillus sp. JY-23]